MLTRVQTSIFVLKAVIITPQVSLAEYHPYLIHVLKDNCSVPDLSI